MTKYILIVALILSVSSVFADMTTKVIVLQEGQSVDLVAEVEWPVVAAWADFDRPIKIGDADTTSLSFQQVFSQRIYGPVTITLRYGDPFPAPEAITSTPDTIGGE